MPWRNALNLHALSELGFRSLANYALYHLGLRSGLWRILTQPGQLVYAPPVDVHFPLHLPSRDQLSHVLGNESKALIQEADEICAGKVRLFGGTSVKLDLDPPGKLHHWTKYESGSINLGADDIKTIWEPGRFGWAYTLARAHLLTASEKYARAFWQFCEQFLDANPPNMGPHWISAQEVALRLVALLFALQAFAASPSTTPERRERTVAAVIAHARRITPTLSYARAQKNNHLLSEALGLYIAGISITDLKESLRWRKTGWRILNQALLDQIASDGTYIQHSTNYHRLMLQVALLFYSAAILNGETLNMQVRQRLAAAASWLISQMDMDYGQVPNLGHNDGAYILPLAPGGFSDYRPVAQAAARAFLGKPCLPAGPWDEFSLWLGLSFKEGSDYSMPAISPSVNRLDGMHTWATLRAAKFTSRPAHADQLHVDLWWQGQNIALDAGTYSYNMSSPWDNSLMSTLVHNTVTVDEQDQMQRAGRFLWVRRAQARLLPSQDPSAVTAEHDGYRELGINHRRTLKLIKDQSWEVVDEITSMHPINSIHRIAIQWLLPDWPWEINDHTITLKSSSGSLILKINLTDSNGLSIKSLDMQLIRAGKVIFGNNKKCSPILGWYSPTYLVKLPALSYNFTCDTILPLTIRSEWLLPGEES